MDWQTQNGAGEVLHVVILAAGKGTRMRSALPKVLHEIGGQPMLARVVQTALALHPAAVHVVIGHGAEQVREAVPVPQVHWVEQREQLGTGHALKMVLPFLPKTGKTLVLYGDVPLIDEASLTALVAAAGDDALGILTDVLDNPFGYGRILRNADGGVAAIVEEKDATAEQRAVREINTGVMVLPNRHLSGWLEALRPANAQGEFYLTDLVGMAAVQGVPVHPVQVAAHHLAAGVNDRVQLAALERIFQRGEAERLMREGVTLLDPARFDLRGTLECGQDVVIDANVLVLGHCVLGDGVRVESHCVLKDVRLGAGTIVSPFSHLDSCETGERALVGPYARLRPGAALEDDVRVGNFVEIKKSRLARGAKVNHLTYVGDASVGENTNVGAGTVTCNYDGVNKSHTEIGANCFIGSGTLLVAPVSVGDGATVGAGSVIVKDCPPDSLNLARAQQVAITGWMRPKKRG